MYVLGGLPLIGLAKETLPLAILSNREVDYGLPILRAKWGEVDGERGWRRRSLVHSLGMFHISFLSRLILIDHGHTEVFVVPRLPTSQDSSEGSKLEDYFDQGLTIYVL